MQSGSVMHSSVTDVKKGLSGAPGELHGSFDLQRDMGQLYANTHAGIFGTLGDDSILGDVKPMEIARRSQIKTGPATILSNVAGEEVKEYQVEIMHLYPSTEGEMRNLMLKVTDPELLAQTGGIVQGMSGSPILQNGRLVGAVTHVLVNDPTRGYGILMENMLEAAG
jgi:stage IV sporulation protein B